VLNLTDAPFRSSGGRVIEFGGILMNGAGRRNEQPGECRSVVILSRFGLEPLLTIVGSPVERPVDKPATFQLFV